MKFLVLFIVYFLCVNGETPELQKGFVPQTSPYLQTQQLPKKDNQEIVQVYLKKINIFLIYQNN